MSVLNAMLKRCVFRRVLNISRDDAFRIVGGRIFHSVGAAMEKDRSPRVLDDLIPGCWRRIDPLDLRARDGCFTFMSWMM